MDIPKEFLEIKSFDVRHLPIIRSYLEKMNLPNIIDAALNCKMKHSPGRVVMGMILDILTGRTPLFRLSEFFEHQDIELLLGEELSLTAFCDNNVGRILDRIFNYGTQKLLTEVSLKTIRSFELDLQYVHEDTTSVSVWGDYKNSDREEVINLTHGHSKDHRPDLKQFMISLLCVEKNVPVFGKIEDGNASDKKINQRILEKIAESMKDFGVKKEEFIYVADSALITGNNLKLLGGIKKKDRIKFVSRLPENYKECARVKAEAVSKNCWTNIGKLTNQPTRKNRPVAEYKSFETSVKIDDQYYRAVVIHSNMLDKRRTKKIDRLLLKDQKILQKEIKIIEKKTFFCKEDACKCADQILTGKYYDFKHQIEEVKIYKKGRPKKGHKKVASIQYRIRLKLSEKKVPIQILKEQAGCFVMITTILKLKKSAKQILEIYKNQYGIEQNFGFLKDPLIVNDLFLKKPERVEALGLILILSLMVWRLIERNLRKWVEKNDRNLVGWDKKKTKKPTTFMMTTKFSSIHVLKKDDIRWFSRELNEVQRQYLEALQLKTDIFVNPLSF